MPHTTSQRLSSGQVLLPWLPYKGLLPEMFPFSHPADLLLMPVDVLSHQNLKKRGEEEEMSILNNA